MNLRPWELSIVLIVVVLWLLTLATTFIAIWVGPWQMTVTACVLFTLACVASGFLIPVYYNVERRR